MMSSLELRGTATAPACPICGDHRFIDFGNRPRERCAGCRALARTRATWLILTEVARIGPGSRVLHFAPEQSLAPRLRALCGESYRPFDFNEKRYAFDFPVGHCDLCTDVPKLFEPESADVVIHNHVLEHLPCNYGMVLLQLQGLLAPGGYHVFSFPIGRRGCYREDLSPNLSEEERKARFGQEDHIRRFTRRDFDRTVGMVFPGLDSAYSLANHIPAERLLAAGIPPGRWTLELGPVFVVPKAGLAAVSAPTSAEPAPAV